MIADTHSHLNFKAYDMDREEVAERTIKEGVVCIDVGTKYETSQRAVELAQKYKNIYASVGMHPAHIKTDLLKIKFDENEVSFQPLGEEFEMEKYMELAKSKKVVAIGEIGLDYYYRPKSKIKEEKFKEKQKQVFMQQLDLAERLDLPAIVHCRMAHEDILKILKHKGVIHCFTGTVEQMRRYIDMGFYIGINGIFFKLDLDDVVKACPLDKILTETDCPYLTPLSVVGSAKLGPDGYVRNEPIFVKHVIRKIADIKGLSFEEVANQTYQNAKDLFKI